MQCLKPKLTYTFAGLAINITCVMADGGRIGLYAGNSLPDGGWSFTFIV